MLVAVATIIGHHSMPHHHHEHIQLLAHHDDHHVEEGTDIDHYDQEQSQDDHHNIFSFFQLDEDFLPTQFSKVNIDLPLLYLLTPSITFHFKQLKENSKTHFGFYREFPPPPKDHSPNLFSRPPPAFIPA
jgi:hypothetical protein